LGELVYGWSFASEIHGGAAFDAALAEWDTLSDEAKAYALEKTIDEIAEEDGVCTKHVQCVAQFNTCDSSRY